MACIQGIYLAFFGRPADPQGLAFWEDQTQGGADLTVMLNALAGTEEYQARFDGMSDTAIISSIYQSLFNRDPEPEGLTFFLEALSEGTLTLTSIAVGILDGAQGDDLIALQNKEEAANQFTTSLDTPEKIAAYVGEQAAEIGRDFISQITSDPETVPSQEDTQNAVGNLPGLAPEEGEAPVGGGGGGGPASTFNILADEDGVVTFAGTAAGPIVITSIVVDGDLTTISASKGGLNRQIEVENFIKIVGSAGQQINISANVIDGFAFDLTGGAQLNVDVNYESLNSSNESLPVYDISKISVDGEYGPAAVANSVNVASIVDKLKLFWASGDAKYYDELPEGVSIDTNLANVEIANIYANYLLSGGSAIVDIVQTKVGGAPDFEARQQSLHDNILANLKDNVIISRFGADAESDPRNADAKSFGDRPEESGNPPKTFSEADAWDALNGVNRPDLVQDVYVSTEGHDVDGFIWVRDRADLKEITTADDPTDPENLVISFEIDKDGAQGSGDPGPAFARYQGASIRTNEDDGFLDIVHGAVVSFDFYIDPDWLNSEAHLSGVWIQLGEPDNTNYSWAIVEYLDAGASAERNQNQHANDGTKPDTDFVGFRFWKTGDGYSKYVAFDETGWVNLSFDFEADQHVWSIDGNEVFSYVDGVVDTSEIIKTLIFNSQNFGNDQSYLYDNIEINGISINEWFYS